MHTECIVYVVYDLILFVYDDAVDSVQWHFILVYIMWSSSHSKYRLPH